MGEEQIFKRIISALQELNDTDLGELADADSPIWASAKRG